MDEAITSKIVTAQSIETKLLEQQTRQVLADKAVLVAEADTEIAKRLAAARAQGSVVEAGAESDAFLVEVRADANATRGLRDGVFARGDASADLAALAAATAAAMSLSAVGPCRPAPAHTLLLPPKSSTRHSRVSCRHSQCMSIRFLFVRRPPL